MRRVILAAFVLLASAGIAVADMNVTLGSGWNGKSVPKGQQCTLFGGKGATPPMNATGLPKGTAWVYVEFNDKDYQPLSTKGGHGIIGYPVSGSSADLYAVPGLKGSLPGKAKVIKKARSSGKYASSGYLPPCSGGKGNRYFADVYAIDANGKVLGKKRVQIGRY
ncbi:hypothetical protein SAMN05444000_102233 [Shimia gijangensis]|uniref:Uncharacterized protein n=1 Tax=Shimia gijangensis TaxID=1470563 RepID=A0A1M6D5N4_9RHOB|nr:hypothetical protein [Shimia gijangensis]SHI68423.1 hypothetical protein SAMN05444000_102233 [Shimia gijangensis]